jgi:hypothetical protein
MLLIEATESRASLYELYQIKKSVKGRMEVSKTLHFPLQQSSQLPFQATAILRFN